MERYKIAEFDRYGREPVLRIMPDHSLLCFFLTGGEKEPGNDNYTAVSRSYDGGKTWTEPEKVFSHEQRGVWTPELFCEGGTPFAVVHTYAAQSVYRELENYFSYTYNSGKTWTEPISPSGPINGCSLRQGIVMSNGEYLFPLYWQEIVAEFSFTQTTMQNDIAPWPYRCGVGISSDQGVTWQRYGYIRSDVSLWEPNVVELQPGNLVMYCRNNKGYLMISTSCDFGRHWTEPVLSDIPNADTKVTAIKLENQVFIMSNFSQTPGDRTHLAIYRSRNGINFEPLLDIAGADERFFYPHACPDRENRVLFVAYENAKEHDVLKIPYRELGLE